MSAPGIAAETERQRRLLAAIFAPQADAAACGEVCQDGARRQAGLAAYRGNGLAHACNALRMQFPTVLAMLGTQAFDALCARYWRACPPRRGDLAWVGEELPAYLATVDDLAQWPWLPDSARLDWAAWQASRAAPPCISAADLQRLTEADPADLALQFSACVGHLDSAWPIVTIHQAHQQADADWAAVRQAIAAGTGQTACIWRPLGDPTAAVRIEALEAATSRWVGALARGASIASALDAAGATFDFAAWLREAITQGWLDGVVVLPAE